MARDSEKRRFERLSSRIRCRMRVDESDHSGFVTDLSASGLFVQCSYRPEPGTKVILTLDTNDSEELVLTGVVAREKKVHRGAAAVVRPGVGIALESAPEGYFRLILDLGNE